MSLTRKIAHQTIIQTLGKVFGLVIALISIGLITRYLGAEKYGVYTAVLVFLNLFGVLADWGLHSMLIQFASQPGTDLNKIFVDISLTEDEINKILEVVKNTK